MLKVNEKRVLWKGKFLQSIIITYKDSSGEKREWEAIERINCKGVVAIVPITERGEVLMVRQFRPAVNNFVIEFPAGLVDQNESMEDAARRELLEETGYTAKELSFLIEGPLSPGLPAEILTVYLAKGLMFKGITQRDETENIEVFKVTISDFQNRLSLFTEKGDAVDLKVFGLIELAKKQII